MKNLHKLHDPIVTEITAHIRLGFEPQEGVDQFTKIEY